MAYLGLFLGLALLIYFALRGVSIVFAAVICSLVVVVTNGLPLADTLMQGFALGKLGAFTFAGKFFLLFACGAIFGRVMGDSMAATSIAMAMVNAWGRDKVLWITTLACALLTYGGVVVFVVIFAIYPLGLRLLQEANIPKRLFTGAVALGAGTFTMTALPGTPSIHNVIGSVGFGTDLYAGALLGIIGSAIILGAGMFYLERERRLAEARGEVFEPGPNDRIVDINDSANYPSWMASLLPILVVLGTILLPRLMSEGGGDVMAFARSQPILWPCFALMLGSVVALAMFPQVRTRAFEVMGQGTQESIMPLISTAAVIGFGGVVTQTAGFQSFITTMAGLDLPPLLKLFTSVSLISGVTGSATGGLQIFMQTMAPAYLELGISAEVLHRIAVMASGGLDSLPHCGAVIAMLTITGLTHKQAYKDVAMVTIVIPIVATLICIGLVPIL
jgi:H+/gluconate symporter-like permease